MPKTNANYRVISYIPKNLFEVLVYMHANNVAGYSDLKAHSKENGDLLTNFPLSTLKKAGVIKQQLGFGSKYELVDRNKVGKIIALIESIDRYGIGESENHIVDCAAWYMNFISSSTEYHSPHEHKEWGRIVRFRMRYLTTGHEDFLEKRSSPTHWRKYEYRVKDKMRPIVEVWQEVTKLFKSFSPPEGIDCGGQLRTLPRMRMSMLLTIRHLLTHGEMTMLEWLQAMRAGRVDGCSTQLSIATIKSPIVTLLKMGIFCKRQTGGVDAVYQIADPAAMSKLVELLDSIDNFGIELKERTALNAAYFFYKDFSPENQWVEGDYSPEWTYMRNRILSVPNNMALQLFEREKINNRVALKWRLTEKAVKYVKVWDDIIVILEKYYKLNINK